MDESVTLGVSCAFCECRCFILSLRKERKQKTAKFQAKSEECLGLTRKEKLE